MIGGYNLHMTGDEQIMLEKHEKILTEQVLPDIESLKGIQASHAKRMEAYEKAQEEAKNQQIQLANQQQALANDVQGVKNDVKSVDLTIQNIGKDLKDQNKQLFDHVLGLNNTKVQHEGAMSIAKLDFKSKVIVALCGATGITGFITAAVVAYMNMK
jgi:seryl-tRNA synthetase